MAKTRFELTSYKDRNAQLPIALDRYLISLIVSLSASPKYKRGVQPRRMRCGPVNMPCALCLLPLPLPGRYPRECHRLRAGLNVHPWASFQESAIFQFARLVSLLLFFKSSTKAL